MFVVWSRETQSSCRAIWLGAKNAETTERAEGESSSSAQPELRLNCCERDNCDKGSVSGDLPSRPLTRPKTNEVASLGSRTSLNCLNKKSVDIFMMSHNV